MNVCMCVCVRNEVGWKKAIVSFFCLLLLLLIQKETLLRLNRGEAKRGRLLMDDIVCKLQRLAFVCLRRLVIRRFFTPPLLFKKS